MNRMKKTKDVGGDGALRLSAALPVILAAAFTGWLGHVAGLSARLCVAMMLLSEFILAAISLPL